MAKGRTTSDASRRPPPRPPLPRTPRPVWCSSPSSDPPSCSVGEVGLQPATTSAPAGPSSSAESAAPLSSRPLSPSGNASSPVSGPVTSAFNGGARWCRGKGGQDQEAHNSGNPRCLLILLLLLLLRLLPQEILSIQCDKQTQLDPFLLRGQRLPTQVPIRPWFMRRVFLRGADLRLTLSGLPIAARNVADGTR